ncbi:MAG: DoxX family protein [Deltaproteobacteria bacterium]|nr:DoxX family protein [Deltaproteobacteria bacterium]
MRRVFRVLLALFMIGAGVTHFTNPEFFVRMVPAWLPDPLWVTWVSGVCELLLGVGLLVPRVRPFAGLALMAFYVAVFPANLNMALHPTETGAADMPALGLWLRLPFQGVLIALAWWVSRPDVPSKKTQ